ncbi:MAG: hypothetical protein ACRDRL_02375 [Sciscionella sp.]
MRGAALLVGVDVSITQWRQRADERAQRLGDRSRSLGAGDPRSLGGHAKGDAPAQQNREYVALIRGQPRHRVSHQPGGGHRLLSGDR